MFISGIDVKQERINSLRRTINFLSTQTQMAIEYIDKDPEMAKLILKEMFSDNCYLYK